jgi:hypothetical protein
VTLRANFRLCAAAIDGQHNRAGIGEFSPAVAVGCRFRQKVITATRIHSELAPVGGWRNRRHRRRLPDLLGDRFDDSSLAQPLDGRFVQGALGPATPTFPRVLIRAKYMIE